MTMKKFVLFFLLFFYLTNSSFSKNWIISSGDYGSSKFSNLEQINKKNLQNLNTAWVYKNGYISDRNKSFSNNQATPIFTGKSLIVTSLDNNLISLNPKNGKEKWRLKLQGPAAKRGMTFLDENIFVPSLGGVYVVNEKSGKLNSLFGKNGLIGTGDEIVSLVPPIVLNDKIFIMYKTFLTSHDLPSGNLNWKLDLNGARVWSGISYDETTNSIIFVTSNLVNLLGKTDIENDLTNSVVVVDSKSGKIKCNFKDTIHDHWDLDMVGNPIIVKKKINSGEFKKVAYALSKTGNTFEINLSDCTLANKDSIKKIITDNNSPIKNQTYSNYQIEISNPENLMTLKYSLEEYLKYISQDKDNYNYIIHRTRNAKYDESYIPLSFDYDVIMYGLHGGPEWPGGTYDKKNKQIIVPTNHYPWIIRIYYTCCSKENVSEVKRKFDLSFVNLPNLKGYLIYQQKCKSCHGKRKNGNYQAEFIGDKYIPSLNGVSTLKKFQSLNKVSEFEYAHKYSSKIKIDQNDLNALKNYFIDRDNYLMNKDIYRTEGKWQLLLDKYGKFASIPPHGKITSFSIKNGIKNWQIPFGEIEINNNKTKGDMNFGGLLSTGGDITIATGTTDNKVIIIDSENGKKLWEKKLEFAGSSPPMTYIYDGEQYIIINASGGRYYGYENILGDAIYAFKIL